MEAKLGLFIIIGACLIAAIPTHQASPYSLQSAVNALNRRETQLAYRDNNFNGPEEADDFSDDESNYDNENWNEGYYPVRARRSQYNKMLANYLARENIYNDDIFGPIQAYKRSSFRERDYPATYSTVFRERENLNQPDKPETSELVHKFLHAIERLRNQERKDNYKEELHKLWDRYQLQENEIGKELFKESDDVMHGNELENTDYADGDEDLYARKRQLGEAEQAPLYWNNQKRDFPILPWLPATRKKRFPVAKRSPAKFIPHEELQKSEMNVKVEKDLQDLFGSPNADEENKKKKRSSGDAPSPQPETETKLDSKVEQKVEKVTESPVPSHMMTHDRSEHDHSDHDHSEHDHQHKEESGEEEENSEDDFDNESSEGDSENGDDDKKKKKREAKSEVSTNEFKWSNIFGIDRRKKSLSTSGNSGYYPLHRPGSLRNKKEDEFDYEELDGDSKLDAMSEKLKNIENLIIQDTVRYTGAHEGSVDPEELAKMKTHVANRLATAYGVEKMRKAIEKLKDSLRYEKNMEQNFFGSDLNSRTDKDDDKKRSIKRVASKKEKVEMNHSDHGANSLPSKVVDQHDNLLDDDKKKRLNGKNAELQNLHTPGQRLVNEVYMGTNDIDDCPLLDAMERRCRGIDVLSGDLHQNLLEICGVHQICYLCGSESQTRCDYEYLGDADVVCGHNGACQDAARSALMVLRGFPGPQLGIKECSKNPCLLQAIQAIEK